MSTPTPIGQFNRKIVIDPDPKGWANAPVLVLAACDSKYLRHAIALARSLDAFGGGHHLMLHVVNPDGEDVARLKILAEQLRDAVLHVSAEQTSLSDSKGELAYYASARFLRMAELLAHPDSRVPIFALDADALFVDELTLDFSDKPEADICLRRRDLKGPVEDHLRVAAGAVWARGSDAAAMFMGGVSASLVERFDRGQASWFVDQLVLLEHIEECTGGAQVRNLKTKFSDWNMSEDAIVWTGKGEKKYLDVRYLLMRHMFDEDGKRRESAQRLLHEVASAMPELLAQNMGTKIRKATGSAGRMRCAIFLPRLDLPWKYSGLTADGRARPIAADVVELRLWWKRFAMELARTITNRDAEPLLIEIPAWEITPERVDAEGVDLAFIPHRCNIDFGSTMTPRYFYMQEYFRPVFVVDRDGWSAASSVYPVDADALPPAVLGAWDDYRAAFLEGRLDSKFEQSIGMGRSDLERQARIPKNPYIFYPLQIPHDQSIRYFSDVDQDVAMGAVLGLARQTGLSLVMKAHPANQALMRQIRDRYRAEAIFWSDAHVHDLIRHSEGVVTINSGVGFEALLGIRPMVCMGRAEYDVAAHRSTPASLAEAWARAVDEPLDKRERRYSRFVDWFLARHAIDLSRPAASRYVLDKKIGDALEHAIRARAAYQ